MKIDKCKAWFSFSLIITIILVAFSTPLQAQVLVGENFPITTAPEFESGPAVAANPANGEFLTVWHNSLKISDNPPAFKLVILGQRIASDGALVGGSFLVTAAADSNPALGGSNPTIAFNSQTNEFFVVYERGYFGSTNNGIFGQRIAGDGSLIGEEITVFQSSSQNSPAVAYNSISNQYLVVWKSEGVAVVQGQIIDHEGLPLGPRFDLSTGLSGAGNPAVAFNSITNQYLVVFDAFSQSVADIFGRIVNADGTLAGTFFAITKADGMQAFPSVTFNTATNQYFVVWSDDRNTGVLGPNTFGQLVNADGSLDGLNFHVSDNTIFPKVSYFPNMNQYLVLWTEQTSGTPGNCFLLGQLLTSDLNLHSGVFQVSDAGWALYAALDVNPSTEIALVIWPDERNYQSSQADIYGQLIYVSTHVSDVSVDITDNPDLVTVGTNLTYTITVSNNGPEVATGVVVTDTLPSGVVFISSNSTNGMCSEASGKVTCNLGDMNKGVTATLTIITTPNTAGTITNIATVSSTSNDPDTTNNTANVNTSVIMLPITLQSPFNGALFASCSLINTYQPSFNWTVTETFSRYSILFSISPTDFTTPIAKANIQGTKNSWIPSIGLWKRILTSSYNNGSIRDIYWKITGTRGDRTKAESEVRGFRVGTQEAVSVDAPYDGVVFHTSTPATFTFHANCNAKFRLEFSPSRDFEDPAQIKAFVFSIKDPNIETVIEKTLNPGQLKSLSNLVGTGKGYFRIKAWDGIRRETVSAARSFTIVVTEPMGTCYRASMSGAGWVTIDYPTTDSVYTTQSTSVYLSGKAFISPTWWRCCSGSAEDTGVIVTWTNCTTGKSGRAHQSVRYGWLVPLYDHRWDASVNLAVGDNFITVTASDPSGNRGTAVIKVMRVP